MSPRTVAQPIIRQVLAATQGQSEPAIRKALRQAYPFGPLPPAGDQYAYKVWLSEIRLQRCPPPRRAASPLTPRRPAPRPAGGASPLQRGPRAPRTCRPAPTAPPGTPGRRPRGRPPFPPLPQLHAYSRLDLVVERVEHLPPPAAPCCRACGQLGALVSVTDMRGARRLRRACAGNELGWTDIDWPACPHYQARTSP